jgi:hypothetical protein
MLNFTAGMVAMGYLIAGLFFLRFWFRIRDILFPVFAFAFWLLALNEALLTIFQIQQESKSIIFLLRLAAFVLIAAAIILKNISGGTSRKAETSAARARRSA